ncbi:MAG TPA: NAD(P)-dependent oxidoreductase [Candidatus Limnocylindrales bacterium]
MRVAISGSGGRLGRAVLAAFADAPFTGIAGPLAWHRPNYDLDDRLAAGRLIERDRPEVIIHAAAWTDVDGCARDPELALRRNGEAVGELARVAAAAGIDLVLVSTNEVFDGRRTDGLGYVPEDEPNPINAYGASKLAGEVAARAAYRNGPGLAIVRTAWLYGPPGNDFPEKIGRAAERARTAGEALRVVADETGSPSYTADVAEAIVELVGSGEPLAGIHHLVNAGRATRADWARAVLAGLGIDVALDEVPAATWPRASTPPAWAVLQPTRLPSGEPIRPWVAGLADYLPALRRQLAAPPATVAGGRR